MPGALWLSLRDYPLRPRLSDSFVIALVFGQGEISKQSKGLNVKYLFF